MSTSAPHRPRQIFSRVLAYLSMTLGLAFLYFLIFDFGGNAWPLLGFAAIVLLIVANTVSHTGSGSDHDLLGKADEPH